MSEVINIIPQPANTVEISNPVTSILTVNQDDTSVVVELTSTNIVSVVAPGPQGPPGPVGSDDNTDYLMYYDLAKG